MKRELTRIDCLSKTSELEQDKNILKGVLVVCAGEAKGHDIWLDDSFCEDVAKAINSSMLGIKSRFGHPDMCSNSFGTYLGRFKNASLVQVTRETGVCLGVRADLHISASAKISPNGNLADYVVEMSENDSDMFATSIVFARDKIYRKTKEGFNAYISDEGFVDVDGETFDSDVEFSEEVYVSLKKLYGCDCVDEGAANDSFFSDLTVAGRVTALLDESPELVKSFLEDEEIMKALKKNPEIINTFLEKYNSKTEEKKMEETKELKAPEKKEALKDESKEQLSETIKKIRESFGADIACEILENGGGYQDALQKAYDSQSAYIAELQEHNKELNEKIAHFNELPGGDPATFSTESQKIKSVYNQEAK